MTPDARPCPGQRIGGGQPLAGSILLRSPVRSLPANDRPYRLTVYLLDYDCAERSVEAVIAGSFGERLDVRAP